MQIGPKMRLGGSVGHFLGKAQRILPSTGADIGGALGGPAGYVVGSAVGSKATGKGWTGNLASDAVKGALIAGAGAGAAALGAGGGAEVAGGGSGVLGTAKKIVTGPGGAIVDGAENLLGGGRGGVLDKLLLGTGIATSAADQKRKQDMQNRAEKYAVDSYNSRAPLREQGRSMALNPEKPDLSSIFASPGNAYDDQQRGTVGPRVPVRHLSY